MARLSEDVGEKRSLLVVCCAFRCKNTAEFPNLTVKKIPNAVLSKCEWGKDDYSLEIKNLPAGFPPPEPVATPTPRSGKKAVPAGPTLFDDSEAE